MSKYNDDREAIEAHGYDADTTPIDKMMAGPDQMHRDVAAALSDEDGGDGGTAF